MATLTVTGSHNYVGEDLGPDPIDQIEYTAAATATFSDTQFGTGNGLIANNVLITGNSFANNLQVNMTSSTFSAAGWQFATWNATNTIIIFGTSGNDTITGSAQKDQIFTGDGADSVNAGGGDDFITVSTGSFGAGEAINGGLGFDTIQIGSGSHDFTLAGTIIINVERLFFTGNNTSVIASGSHFGGAADLTTVGGNSANTQALTVNGSSVNLSTINFTGWGGANQTININGTVGNDTLTGSNQDETFSSNVGFDTIDGGDGDDTIGGGDNGDNLFGGAGSDVINGGMGLDTIDGGIENDTINGGLGGDTIFGNLGFDEILGNDGNDTINGGDQGDVITGDAGDDFIGGGMGLDTIDGGAGNDTITGGMGNDQLTGGTDADTFAFGSPGATNDGIDTIIDFVSGTDALQVSATGYGGDLVANGAVTLVTTDSAANANSGAGGYFILDNFGTDIGTVYWDVNGGSGADAVAVIVLTGVTTLQATDFNVV